MWHDSRKLRIIFIFGAMVSLIGLVAISKGQNLPGAILLSVGIAILVISFAVLRLKLAISFNR